MKKNKALNSIVGLQYSEILARQKVTKGEGTQKGPTKPKQHNIRTLKSQGDVSCKKAYFAIQSNFDI